MTFFFFFTKVHIKSFFFVLAHSRHLENKMSGTKLPCTLTYWYNSKVILVNIFIPFYATIFSFSFIPAENRNTYLSWLLSNAQLWGCSPSCVGTILPNPIYLFHPCELSSIFGCKWDVMLWLFKSTSDESKLVSKAVLYTASTYNQGSVICH